MKNQLYGLVGIIVLLAAMSGLSAPMAEEVEVIVITNPSVPDADITAGDLQKIFLGKKTSWSDKSSVSPAILDEGPVHEGFLKTYIKKTAKKFSGFWKKAVFTGTGTPPKSCKTEADIVAYVSATAGAVGYVGKGFSDLAGVKTISVK